MRPDKPLSGMPVWVLAFLWKGVSEFLSRRTMVFGLRIGLDAVLSVLSFWLAVTLRFEFRPPADFLRQSIAPCLIFAFIIIICNAAARNYRFTWVHVSILEALRVMLASLAAFLIIVILHVSTLLVYSISVTLIYLCLFTMLSEGIRFSFRSMYVLRKLFGLYTGGAGHTKNVLVIADRDTAGLFLRRLLQGKQMRFRPAAVLTDEAGEDQSILGVKVFTDRAALPSILEQYGIDEIVLLADYYGYKDIVWLRQESDRHGCVIKIFQGLQSMSEQNGRPVTFRPLKIEDLLGRNEIHLEKTWIDAFIAGKRVLVTGAAGSIGSEICRQCLEFHCATLYTLDIDENALYELELELETQRSSAQHVVSLVASIRDENRLSAVFDRYQPEVVFHAAAHKHVPMMEKNPCEAVKNNVFGTLNVLRVCEEQGVGKLIVISTDKAVNPSSVMGATKRITEMLVQTYGQTMKTEVTAVRFGNVLGSNGSVVPIFQRQISAGGPVTLMHRDIERYFMTISEAVQLVMQAGALASRGEIFVFDMGRSVKIYDLACEMIRLSGLEPEKDIEIKIIGLRPGEKLFEELRLDMEHMDSTKHANIFVCKPLDFSMEKMNAQLAHLQKAVDSENDSAAVEYLFSMVPSIYRKPSLTTHPIKTINQEVYP